MSVVRLILTLPISRGFTFHPFIVIPEWATKTEAIKASYLAHEQTHYERQKNFFYALWWVFRYFASKKFRFEEEVTAFASEIKTLKALGQKPKVSDFARTLSEQYWGACDYQTALERLEEELRS